ncbi:MAG: MBL fold metallo-hydrolase [Rhodovibrionaceae bacterium]|nr:MBL fold metallo-hydrolase [Rhodovibrionaceae bacterium]
MLRLALILTCLSLAFAWPKSVFASHCLAYVGAPNSLVPASVGRASEARAVTITYLGHSTFRLRTPEGVVIETDYAGRFGDDTTPTVVTMNHAHPTHYTDFPDPRIEHVLRGWNPAGGPARHDLRIGDVEIRNVTTDVRRWGNRVEPDGNSIFIFEVADLCIAHLGHLHQKLSAAQRALIGRLDIVFAPVDGSYTLDLGSMIGVLKELRASLIIPMHYFGGESLRVFLAGIGRHFDIEFADAASVEVSLESLPNRPTVLVLQRY